MQAIFLGPHGLRAGWRTLIFIGLFVIVAFGLSHLLAGTVKDLVAQSGGQTGPRVSLLRELPLIAGVLVATWIMARAEHRPLLAYGMADCRALARFMNGTLSGFLAISVEIGLLAASGHLVFEGHAPDALTAIRFAAEWGVFYLLVALVEENLLRGYLQQTLARGMGFWPAAVLLSLAFGALHAGNSGEEIIGLLGAAVGGFVLAYSLWRSGSLWWAIGAHTGIGWAESYFYGTHNSGIASSPRFLATHPVGAGWLSGATVGPEGSIFFLLLLLALVPVIRWTLAPTDVRDARPRYAAADSVPER